MPPSGLVNAPDGARERSRWGLNAPDGAREPREPCKRLRMDSSYIRLTQTLFKEIFPLIRYLIQLEPGSKPVRNVRMQWSNTYLLVFTMPPSGLVNIPDGS